MRSFSLSHRAPDGKTLILSSQDGYCSIVAFTPGELGTPYTGPQPHLPHSSTSLNPASVPAPQPVGSTSGERKLEDMFASTSSLATSSTSTTPSTSQASSSATSAIPAPSSSSSSMTIPEKRPASPSTGGSGTTANPHQLQVKKKKKVVPTLVAPIPGGEPSSSTVQEKKD